jgi:BMFP domain-containing protein YqiC
MTDSKPEWRAGFGTVDAELSKTVQELREEVNKEFETTVEEIVEQLDCGVEFPAHPQSHSDED